MVLTLQKFVPILLLTLSFTIPLTSGKFNIGGEGQMLLGAIGATIVGITLSGYGIPQPIMLPLALLAGIFFGLLWAAIPAWMLYKFSINEILTTILMNFISTG